MDLRVRKTYAALNRAFTSLLSQKPYERISVAELCEAAEIRRTTFYKHFRDKDAFFSAFVSALRIDLTGEGESSAAATESPDPAAFADAPSPASRAARLAIIRRLADFLLAHEAMMDNVMRSSMAGAMFLVICDNLACAVRDRYDGDGLSDEERAGIRRASEFAAGGIVRLMMLWWDSADRRDGADGFVTEADALVGRVMEG